MQQIGLTSVCACLALINAVLAGRPQSSPFYEPSLEEYFNLPGDSSSLPISVDRVRDVSPEEFSRRVRAGIPFVIEDAGRDNPLLGSTCENFHERFPQAKMRAEYTKGRREEFISLGGKDWFKKDRRVRQKHAGKVLGKDGSPALNAPYVWHLKDGGHEAPPHIRASAQAHWVPPYFLHGDVNIREANESAEFWFVRAP
eukprot:6455370-Amphidinium_carterae.2